MIRRRRLIVVSVAVAVAAVVAGCKWGGSAQASAGIECSPYCNVQNPPVQYLPEPGPCFYHGGVVWVIPGFEGGEYVLYYGCHDGEVKVVRG